MIRKIFVIFSSLVIVVIIIVIVLVTRLSRQGGEFNGQRAYEDVKYQVDLGPRVMGSQAHERVAEWIISTLEGDRWQVETQETIVSGQAVKNIIAKRGSGVPWIILASHYDSRSLADKDPDPNKRNQPVPGANDGASTVSILLELARVIPTNLNKQIWLVFLDNEDNGNNKGAGWSIGSDYFVSQLAGKPDAVVVLDMLGDKNLDIYMERQSDRELNSEIWGVAKELGNSQFIPSYKYTIIDDHVPFIKAGINAVDVIDINYPYWHTTQDTLDKISPNSLKVIGDTMLAWLEQYSK